MPTCRVTPHSASEVATAFNIIKEGGCSYVVRSGGHMTVQNSNTLSDGIVFDFSSLNTIELSEDKSSVSVGPGARWADVYTYLETYGLAVVGGRVSDVGVGGLLLGGGMSFLSNRHGWAADNVLSHEVRHPSLANPMNVLANT
jgi:FAD/FMN-containing dehydrogenase